MALSGTRVQYRLGWAYSLVPSPSFFACREARRETRAKRARLPTRGKRGTGDEAR